MKENEEIFRERSGVTEHMRQVALECGTEINLAIPMYEDPTRYPVDQLIDLFQCQTEMTQAETAEERTRLKTVFSKKRQAIQPLPDAPERIYLWPEGNMPVQTVYTENKGNLYNHEPDFKPYMLEMTVPESQFPKAAGAILLVAGGEHGAGTINECYQIGLEFNQLGYQCFILQCRPNQGPWNGYETGADAARAIRWVRSQAKQYRISPEHIAYAGFSNGGCTGDKCIEHYSGNQKVSDYFPEYVPDDLDQLSGSMNAYICVYGVRHAGTDYNEAGVKYPPTFIAVGREDHVCIKNLEAFMPWVIARDIPVEVHTFAGHPHGYAGWKIIDGKGDPNFDFWVTHADRFLKDIFKDN